MVWRGLASDFSPANVAGLRRNAVLAASFVFGLAVAVSLAAPVDNAAALMPGGGGHLGTMEGGAPGGDGPVGDAPGQGMAVVPGQPGGGAQPGAPGPESGAPTGEPTQGPSSGPDGGPDANTSTSGAPSAGPICLECLGDPNSMPDGLPPVTLGEEAEALLSSTSSSPSSAPTSQDGSTSSSAPPPPPPPPPPVPPLPTSLPPITLPPIG